MTLEQAVAHGRKGCIFLRHHGDLHFHTNATGKAQNLSRRFTGFFKRHGFRTDTITVQTDGDMFRFPYEMFQNCHMLPGKVGKTIYVKYPFFSIIAIFQFFQNPVHLISWIPFTPLA